MTTAPDVAEPVEFGRVVPHAGGVVTVGLRGELSEAGWTVVHDRLVELLSAHPGVVLDIDRLRLADTAVVRVFGSALMQAGGWPEAKLTLVSADPLMRATVHASGVGRIVGVARDAALALVRSGIRPRQVRARWTAAAARTSPAWLRARVRARCACWGVGEDAIDDLLLVLTELVSNVVDHAGTPMTVHLFYDDATLRVWVHDSSPAEPCLRPHDPYAGRGRGLQLVDALSTQWGWATTRAGGKTLWAILTPSG